ncbi:MAG: hypothetical protein LH632_22475 [Rhodoferax sp.]|nr:hypothetical protein [Rhodoferax sp.]
MNAKGQDRQTLQTRRCEDATGVLGDPQRQAPLQVQEGRDPVGIAPQANAQTDLPAAQQMQKAKVELFGMFNKTRLRRQA